MRPIDAEALYNDLKESIKAAREWKEEAQDEEIKIRAEQAHGTFCECALRVKNAPTIEADRPGREEPEPARWLNRKRNGYAVLVCSACEKQKEGYSRTAYCPNCGRPMTGEGEQGCE